LPRARSWRVAEMMPALVTTAVGVVLLVVAAVVVLSSVRRFTRARTTLRVQAMERIVALRAEAQERRKSPS
jgi:hypothetical protein